MLLLDFGLAALYQDIELKNTEIANFFQAGNKICEINTIVEKGVIMIIKVSMVSLKRIGKCLSGDNSNELKQLTKQFLVKIVADLTIPLRYYWLLSYSRIHKKTQQLLSG